MNPDQISSLQNVIEQKIQEAKNSIEAYKESSKPVQPDNAIGRLTRMEAINSRSINEASLAKAKQLLIGLNKSYKMLSDPDFGYCAHCEESIPYKRLLIMPEARFCVACTEKLAKKD